MNPVINFTLAQALQEEGLLPIGWDFRKVEVLVAHDDVLVMRYEVIVNVDDVPKLSRAFARLALSVGAAT